MLAVHLEIWVVKAMSKYTTEVRYICESLAGHKKSVGADDVDEVLKRAYSSIFGDFPIFDESYRESLCCKILKHYYTREICEETFGLWKLRMNTIINEVIPYYNELYNSARMKFEVFDNVNLERIISRDTKGNNESNQEQHGNSLNAFSDTPMGSLSGVEDNKYLTNATKNKQDISGNNKGNYNEQESAKETVKGKNNTESNAKLLLEYRETLINIDKLVIGEFKDCFIQLW